jgi:glucosamine--fructose-6-phosphate aminotransferase (isomerizing)
MIALEEIRQQPDILQGWLDRQLESTRKFAAEIRKRKVEYVYLAARGTSDHAGIYAQYIWGALAGLPVALAAPSLFTLYKAAPKLARALVVGISQSGESPDIVQVIQEGRRQGAVTVSITNVESSPLESAAEYAIHLGAGTERAVAASKTYTAELMAVAALAALLSGSDANVQALHGVPDAVRCSLDLEPLLGEKVAAFTGMDNCLVIGRGFNYCTAREWALKMKEVTYIHAEAYSSADFLHGPIAIVGGGDVVMIVAPAGRTEKDFVRLLTTLQDQKKARVVLITDDSALVHSVPDGFLIPDTTPEWLTPITAIVPAQLFSVLLAGALGLNPDSPRGLSKVTRTL